MAVAAAAAATNIVLVPVVVAVVVMADITSREQMSCVNAYLTNGVNMERGRLCGLV